MSTTKPDILTQVGDLIPLVLEEYVPSRQKRSEIMGAVWQDCVERAQREPAALAAARSPRELKELVAKLVGTSLASASAGDSAHAATLRSGCVGTFIDEQLRDLEPSDDEAPVAEPPDEPLARHPLVADALTRAREESNETLIRNLHWMLDRDEGVSYDAIAEAAKVPAASVRTGVRRARQVVRRIAHEKRRAAHAPHQGECPPELVAARDAWRDGSLAEMIRALEAARPALEEHPYYLFLLGLCSDDSGDRERAIACFEKVLLTDDEPSLRAKVLNCLGYVADDAADRELARFYWARSIEVDPSHTPAQVNALKNACDREDKLDMHVCIDRIGELLTGRSLGAEDKHYLLTRLKDHPDFAWARSFEAWRRGPARWIARLEDSEPLAEGEAEAGNRPARRVSRAVVGALAVFLALGAPALHLGGASGSSLTDPGPPLDTTGSGDRGGLRHDPLEIA